MSQEKFVDFKALKQSVTMLQILDHYGLTQKLKRTGDALSGVNPFSPGSDNPSRFRVSVSKNCWNLFGSDKHGNVLDFVAEMERVSVREAALRIAEWFNLDTGRPQRQAKTTPAKPKSEPAPAPLTAETRENRPLGFELQNLNTAHPYLEARGLDEETIATFGLGLCSKGSMAGRIVIPIHNKDGQLVAYAGRFPGDPPEGEGKYKLPAGFHKSAELFNLHRATPEVRADCPLIVVEGFFDVIHLWQLGCRTAVALMGSTLSEEQARLVAAHAKGKVLLMFDQDAAGEEGMHKALLLLAPELFVRVIRLPSNLAQPEQLSSEDLEALLHWKGTFEATPSETQDA